MTDLTYDPELPFAAVDTVGKVEARFKGESDAKIWIHDVAGYGRVVDTTPKPKIPEDAEFVYMELKDGPYYVRKREDGAWVDQTSSQFTSTDHLTRFLKGEGDAEVTVLVRKGES